MDIIRNFICPICNSVYHTEEDALKCLNQPKQEPLVSVGDTIIFNDCERTPIIYGKIFTKNAAMVLSDPYNCKLAPQGYIDMVERIKATQVIGNDTEYTVSKIITRGHDIIYYLSSGNDIVDFIFTDFTGKVYMYPVIERNEFMQKVLDEYNNGGTK